MGSEDGGARARTERTAESLDVLLLCRSVVLLLERPRSKVLDVVRDAKGDGRVVDVVLVVARIFLVAISLRIHLHSIRLALRQLSAIRDEDLLDWGILLDRRLVDKPHDRTACDDLAEDDVLFVEVRGCDGRDEELGAVRAGSGVGHGEEEGLVVLEYEAARRGQLKWSRLELAKLVETVAHFSSANLSP